VFSKTECGARHGSRIRNRKYDALLGLSRERATREKKTMLNISNIMKSAAVAGLVGLGFAGASATPASADTFETRCTSYGDCYRVRCDDFHDNCYRTGYYGSDYSGSRRWVCDEEGDNCHWAYSDGYYHHYYRPGVSFGFHF
jgi:hypothetical protein